MVFHNCLPEPFGFSEKRGALFSIEHFIFVLGDLAGYLKYIFKLANVWKANVTKPGLPYLEHTL